MATSIKEANAINRVLCYLLGERGGDPKQTLDAVLLAGRAYGVLLAGIHPEEVQAGWERAEQAAAIPPSTINALYRVLAAAELPEEERAVLMPQAAEEARQRLVADLTLRQGADLLADWALWKAGKKDG